MNGEDNSRNSPGPGIIQSISRATAPKGVCTLIIAQPLANGLKLEDTWIAVSGADGSGGAVNMDTAAVQALHVDSSTRTITYPCPNASGGPATAGKVGTASTANTYAVLGKLEAGYHDL